MNLILLSKEPELNIKDKGRDEKTRKLLLESIESYMLYALRELNKAKGKIINNKKIETLSLSFKDMLKDISIILKYY
jgi:hypothetical protein